MNVISSLFKIAEHSLGIYDTKLSRKYLERVLYLRKVYDVEQNKDELFRSHAIMDNCLRELCLIIDTITEFGKPGIED